MIAQVKCSICGKRFKDAHAQNQHARAKHGGKGSPVHIPTDDDEPSIADRVIEAQLQQAMGEPVEEDWLLDMLP